MSVIFLVKMTTPSNRVIDTTGKFCKECGTKARDEKAPVCHVCGTAFPVVAKGPAVIVDKDALLANRK